jgi:GDP-L-fucose synthase
VNPSAKIYVAGHRGLVGSALMRKLLADGFTNLVVRTHAELDLIDPQSVRGFFEQEQPEYVFLAAALVGGILANSTYPAEFIGQNLPIQMNVIHQAYRAGVKRLLFLGSSCIYPKNAPQPIKEEYLLTGPLEPTNRPYAVAKISGIEMCRAYNQQYGTRFLAAMPTNVYGPGDRYDLHDAHVIPALIRRMHEAKASGADQVVLWGTGTPRREFLHSDDAAEACVFLMKLKEEKLDSLIANEHLPPIINVGCGKDLTVEELAKLIADVVGFKKKIVFDATKPDGTPRKLLDTSCLTAWGWNPRIPLREGLITAYKDFTERSACASEPRPVSTGAV